MIESQSYFVSNEETSLKRELEVSLQKFFEFYDELIQNRTQLDSDVFEHFQEMRFKIDEHREEYGGRATHAASARTNIKRVDGSYVESCPRKSD